LNQLRAVKLSMRAIREVIPGAQLVQTEDMGKTYSTELLAYQSELENERKVRPGPRGTYTLRYVMRDTDTVMMEGTHGSRHSATRATSCRTASRKYP
jgi:hypothetical protein